MRKKIILAALALVVGLAVFISQTWNEGLTTLQLSNPTTLTANTTVAATAVGADPYANNAAPGTTQFP